MKKLTNYFEVIGYVKDTVTKLGLQMKTGDNVILSNASFYIHQIAKKEGIRENLIELYVTCQMRDYEGLG
ncbi:hypothetical protein MY04_2013 [Flammeovirga sp. MY04]|uniref:hypothetical protein n=1 Tax=Flammeovirga sp. MY04 TaxID=1191459 RepID=UPI0013051541|nr:hypothetical protein [Flammeovirga sp. MY04]ANQ49387.2 hypothetical protein MY04_2013 [Flammeovirga sp. MY04]